MQAAIYLWAQSRSWEDQWELDPTFVAARDHAIASLDVAIARLDTIADRMKSADDAPTENVRFRLAQALADRAVFDLEGSVERTRRLEKALSLLEAPIKEPSLKGFAHLLRGDLLGRFGRHAEALAEVDEATKSQPAPPAEELLEIRVAILIGRKRFDDALKVIGSAPVDDAAQGVLAVRVRLAERDTLPSGKRRSAVESALFERVKTLRASGKPEARRALLSVSRAVTEPDAKQGPDAWEAVAEGALALGEVGRASRCEAQAADRAEALGERPRAAELRLRSGALLFQAEKYAEADALLTRVVDDPEGGPARPKAGLLRALARGQALGLGQPGASQQAYAAALSGLIHDFPDDPATGEARWLLGKLRRAQSNHEEALELWSAMPPDHPRWLESRLAVARLNQDDLDTLRIGNDSGQVKRKFEEARRFLAESRDQARTDAEKNGIELCLARLELTPDIGKPDAARKICERLLHSVTSPEVRGRTSRLHLLALAQLNRYVGAERIARAEASQARPADLLETARLLDHTAWESESGLRLRRFGLLMRILLTRALEREAELTPEQRWEAKLRLTRAQLFSGNTPAAENALGTWSETAPPAGDHFYKDLADMYFRLEAYELAVDVQRLRARQAPSGSLPWFDARYGMALAYYRAGKAKLARQLIDATAILHPDLGGGALREKFVHLRQRLNPE